MIYTEEELRELVDVRASSYIQDVVEEGILVEGTQDRSSSVAETVQNDLGFARAGVREGYFAQACFGCRQVCDRVIALARSMLPPEA